MFNVEELACRNDFDVRFSLKAACQLSRNFVGDDQVDCKQAVK